LEGNDPLGNEQKFTGPFETGLDKNGANHQPLSPLSFLPRAAAVFPARTAVVHGDTSVTWAEAFTRCRRLASALARRGIGAGDCVAVMAPNIPPLWEAHFGVPVLGAVLNALNVRLDAATIAFILEHGEAKVLITDREFSPTIRAALAQLKRDILVIDIDDPQAPAGGERLGEIDYEAFLAGGDPEFPWSLPDDEWRGISLNYTSGTTGNPKGVVYHHRGAYLNAIGNIATWSMGPHPTYLWTLPMFHCNGWCFPWTVTALAGTHVCLRRVEAGAIFAEIAEAKVTHLCGAPIVMQMLLNATAAERRDFDHQVEFMTAAAPPPASVLAAMAEAGIRVTHVYGLTEVYGPAVVCAWHPEWDELPIEEQARLKSRQGVAYPVLEGLMVGDPETLAPVPADGETIGEVFLRGNIVMKGYLKNPEASEEAFAGGWFHSGDLGVCHPDGYIELKDRSKDIIISGGENISSIEVENQLYRHPAVAAAAVVARPDEKWGETPCAFVELKPGVEASEAELIAFCRDNMAHFKAPKSVVFGALPKTSTGKIQKFLLRDQARNLA
jgi:fatty-acyl-CoA synthase